MKTKNTDNISNQAGFDVAKKDDKDFALSQQQQKIKYILKKL